MGSLGAHRVVSASASTSDGRAGRARAVVGLDRGSRSRRRVRSSEQSAGLGRGAWHARVAVPVPRLRLLSSQRGRDGPSMSISTSTGPRASTLGFSSGTSKARRISVWSSVASMRAARGWHRFNRCSTRVCSREPIECESRRRSCLGARPRPSFSMSTSLPVRPSVPGSPACSGTIHGRSRCSVRRHRLRSPRLLRGNKKRGVEVLRIGSQPAWA